MSQQNTIPSALRHCMNVCGEDTPYYIFRDKDGGRNVFTFGRLHRLAGLCSAYLRQKEVGKGSLVMLCLGNSPERLICEFGVLYAGAACVNGLCQMTDGSDLIHCLSHSQASTILLDPDVTPSPWIPLQGVVQRADDGTVTSEKLPHLKHVEFVQRLPGLDFLGRLDKLTEWFMEDDIQRSDNCFVFTTSGTTGFSKLAAHPHGNFATLIEKLTCGLKSSQFEPSVRYQDTHLGTSGGNVCIALSLLETRVLCDVRGGLPRDRAAFIMRCIREEKCTKATLSPADIFAIHQRMEEGIEAVPGSVFYNNDDESSNLLKWEHQLDQISIGGQPVKGKAVEAALCLARTVLVYYGTTEMGIISFKMVKEKGSYEDYNVGHPVPGVQVKVVGEQGETPLPVGQIGQVLVRHPAHFTQYLHDLSDSDNVQTTAAVFTDDGFFHTGDRGKMNPDNSLTVFGRMGDSVIMRGPGVYYPHVIETCISACPGITDVIVVGVPDPLMTEEFCACVVLAEGVSMEEVEEEVEKRLSGPSETLYPLRPRYYLQFDSLPQLYTGKPNRRLIKEMTRKRLGVGLAE